jgi:hypothetical protein
MSNKSLGDYEPQHSSFKGGNNIQTATTNYNGVLITEYTFIPWNVFKNIKVWNVVDLVLPMNTVVENGKMDDLYYTEDGFGLPVFEDVDDALLFINEFKSSNNG